MMIGKILTNEEFCKIMKTVPRKLFKEWELKTGISVVAMDRFRYTDKNIQPRLETYYKLIPLISKHMGWECETMSFYS